MKNRASLAVLAATGAAALLVPAIASAQPSSGYYGGPPPAGGYYAQPTTNAEGYHLRGGRPMLGFSIGLGGMSVNGDDVECATCDYQPIGVEIDAHIGGMLNDRFGLMLELQANVETIEDNAYETQSLTQGVAMIAGQYWLTPRLWIKGGIGLAHLSVDHEDYYGGVTEPVDDGAAIMGAIGYELYSSRTFGLDLQGRLISAGYDGIDSKVNAATIGLGFNWYGFGHVGGGAVVVVH
jgi:hypothetical protein